MTITRTLLAGSPPVLSILLLGTTLTAAGPPQTVPASHEPARVSSSTLVTRQGVRLAFQETGSGPPVVFVHGWLLGAEVWEYQTNFVGRNGYRAIAYDQRGCGDSDKPGDGYDVDSLSDDLNDVLTALDLRNVTLVAHSLGAVEAIRYLSRHGSARVRRLVLIGPITPGGNPEPVQKRIFESMTRTMLQDRPAFIAGALPQGFLAPGGSSGPVSPSMAQWVIGLSMRCSLNAAIESARAVAYTDVRDDLAKITVPTTVIHGARDLSAPLALTGAKTVAGIVGSDLITYEGAGHALFLTEKERLNADLLSILKRSR
jgi:non-heme chloroperoxidase